jgi:hypothetical protein
MYFHLRCECGKDVAVSEGAAGASLACPCGRRVVAPELRDLQRRAAAGEIRCSEFADGEQPPPPPNQIAEATHRVYCWLIFAVGAAILSVGVPLAVVYGRIGCYAVALGFAIMGFVARALANRDYVKAARVSEREQVRTMGEAHRQSILDRFERAGDNVGRPSDKGSSDNPPETSVTERPRS